MDSNPFFFEFYHTSEYGEGFYTKDAIYNLDFFTASYVCYQPDGEICSNFQWWPYYFVPIEMVNLNDGKDPYTPAQIRVVHNLIYFLKIRFPLKYITSHEYIAVPHGRKTDPKGFPWETMNDLGLQIVK